MSDTFVSAAWLADRLDDPGVRLVDVRDAWEYDGIGHLPGAVSIPFDEFRSDAGDEGMLPGAARWAESCSTAGVGGADEIVAYDDEHGVFAARFLVTAELYGHDPARLHLLDGDYSAWSRERPTEHEAPDPEPTDYEPTEPVRSPLVGFEGVEERLGGDTVIVDTREPDEYAAGHLPGAVQLDWLELVDPDSRGLKPREELESILADAGITPDREVLLYCNTARRISHTYLVLRHLGYDDVLFYEGSLTEWEERGGDTVTA
ncbi:sulfurtransferase [Halobaculum gomorrense]|uniref:Thiosulfate/3-mercaptopyruvate sulfurtransferase n=1 Tax=Halobaculum gomorrense TaxID=43928 RepID=A0A1M5SWV0_9EURY|nr:sulfurtransferase [Halobaculum gomorrense]SHH42962.1 thiosulfate/3-mercaptopyruvate sulfurtransferase [Halobaculum gomorrense]